MIFDKLISDKAATGIEVVLKENGQFSFNVVVLKKKGNSISIEKKAEDLKNIEELKTIIDKKIPLVLSLTGKGLIHKKIANSEQPYQLNVLLNKAMPGASLHDFNVQVSEINNEQAFVSIIRSSASDAVLAAFIKNGITNISNCFLGAFALNDVFEQIGLSGTVSIANQQLLIEHNVIAEIQPASIQETTFIHTGTESIPSTLLIAFGAAFSLFIAHGKGIENSEMFNKLKEEYKAKRKFERTGLTALALIFLLLLANYFVFSSYWQKNNELNAIYTLNESAIHQYDTLKKEFAFKKQFLEENGLLEHSKTSFYADQLAKALPASISWTTVKINPQKNIKNAEKNSFLFENKIIDISGKCDQSIDLNQWMKEMKANDWIDKVVLMNFTQVKKTEPGLFTLRLTLK